MAKIALIDCNNFFASCEQLFNPELLNKPVCVMSNNNGCVVARSKEAKALGVKMGMPVFMAEREFPQVIFVEGRLGFYSEISSRIMAMLNNFSPIVEVYSIDEAFIDLTGLRKLYNTSYTGIAKMLKNTIYDEVGIPVSVGIAPTKTLAKIATDRAKSEDGVHEIHRMQINDELKLTKVHEVWGIGSNTAALLNKYNIYSAYNFVSQDKIWVQKNLGKKGIELKSELEGNIISPVINKTELPKSIQKTSSFAKFTDDKNYIKNSLHYHTHRACSKLRRLGMKTKVISVILKTKDFRFFSDKIALVAPTNCEFVVYEAVEKLLNRNYISNTLYRASGVVFENLIQESQEQLSLFGENNSKKETLTRLWDRLEDKYGRGIIKTGSAGND